MKHSGYGTEYGFEAVLEYTRSKSVMWDLTVDRTLPYVDVDASRAAPAPTH